MSEKIDKEIDAIKTILTCLEELEDDVRKNVLDYILKRIKFDTSSFTIESQQPNFGNEKFFTPPQEGSEIHIKQFKEGKNPKSAIEMATIVAYHLQYNVPAGERKEKIGVSDLETWFRIADYPLPKGDMKFLLVNTKNAGYFDSAGTGEYKLNAVGYNLIKHNLPKGDGQSAPRKKRRAAKKAVKKVAKKSTTK
jgi:hypothetical protein